MKAIALVPGTTTVQLVNRPEPSITAEDEIKMRVLRVGICGTDREEAAGGRARGPAGRQELILGHEMFGQVVEVGPAVTRVEPGDYAVFTVRRGCGHCLPCAMNRSDMCCTDDYTERGIWGRDGYQTQYVVDREQYIVRVPPELEPVGVLCEPLSVAEKAIEEAVRLQLARLPDALTTPNWLYGQRCLVAGLGRAWLTNCRRHSYHSRTKRGLAVKALGVANCCGSYLVHSPVCASRKVSTPLSAGRPF